MALDALASLEQAILACGAPVQLPRAAVSGSPLLSTAAAEPVIGAAARSISPLLAAITGAQVPRALLDACAALKQEVDCDSGAAERLVRSAIDGQASGVLAFVAWKAISRALPPLDLAGWNRPDCPACGALPAMAHLHETDRGRERALVCGRCATRFGYRRIGCPFCGTDDASALGVLEPGDGKDFRVDVCRRCDGYLKTFIGSGRVGTALSDWSTLHLDVACAERGLKRLGPSLYDLTGG